MTLAASNQGVLKSDLGHQMASNSTRWPVYPSYIDIRCPVNPLASEVWPKKTWGKIVYIDIVYLKFMHVHPCLQTVYTFKLITTLYIAELSALLLSLWNPGIQINQVLLSALQGPWPITDPTRDEERKMYRALHLWKFLLHFKILQTASGLFEMMARDGLKLKWYNQANART